MAAQTHYVVGDNGRCMHNASDLESVDDPQIMLRRRDRRRRRPKTFLDRDDSVVDGIEP